ncbi:MAG: hypothetical protein Ta2G_01740 [Termitinemataceae bacterium]|nr:MAG: hypothetical protein Ta2G_01740 [Termitinemataceae bacterium]
MKKIILWVLPLFTLLFVTSCKSAPIVWDDTIPLEQTAGVYFYSMLPTAFNGVGVKWKPYKMIRIPAGDAKFTVNVISDRYTINDAIFSFRFDSGTDYKIGFGTREVAGGRLIVGASVYKGVKSPKESDFIDFIPFENKNPSK